MEHDLMFNPTLLSLIGGSVAAAATLTVGIRLAGMASSPQPETIYVEQPVIELPGTPETIIGPAPDPQIIAILPLAPEADPSTAPGLSPAPASPAPVSDAAEEDEEEYEDEDEAEEDEEEYEDEEEDEDEEAYEDGEDEDGEDD